jgi:acetyl esterase/lipase
MRRLFVLVVGCVAVFASGCVHLTTPEGPAPLRYRDAVFANVTKTTDITYDTALNQQGQTVTLKLDVYSPTGDTETSRPAIVWVHGGGFSSGNKNSPEIVDEANTFARKGYVNVSISYRLTPGGCSASGPTAECVQAIFDAQHDAQSAVRFLRANASTYGVDVDRIAIGGTSAGALTALHVGFNSDDPGDGGNQANRPPYGPRCRCRGPRSSAARAKVTRRACCSTVPTTVSCPTSGRRTP